MARLSDILESVKAAERIKQVLLHLREVGWTRIHRTDGDFANLTLAYRGLDDRDHLLDVRLSDEFPHDQVGYATDDLPQEESGSFFRWVSGKSRLNDLYLAFVAKVDEYAPLRSRLKNLDDNCRVLDPPPPVSGLQHRYRRVVLFKGVSLQVTLDPRDPDSLPDLRFLGPDDKTRPLREMLGRNRHNFDPDYTLVQNIENVLELKLPSGNEAASGSEDYEVECAICYGYRLGDALPVMACNKNTNCGRLFHQECLFEWLRSSPDFRQSFQTVFGKCPFCDTPISCKMPSR